MDRSDLANLTAFVAIAEQRSFRAAASRLHVTPSALSHLMKQLEQRVGVRLLHRTTRSVSVTDAGQRLLEELRPAIDQIAAALENLDGDRLRPLGRLRVHAINDVAAVVTVAPVWERLLSTYPQIHLELHVGDAPVDLIAEGFDAAIGPRELAGPNMIAIRLTGPMKMAIVGAPAYFARKRAPRNPNDLARHSCVQLRLSAKGPAFAWPFKKDGKMRRVPVSGGVTVSDAYLACRAALDGLGIAFTLEAIAEPFLRSGQLVRVLEQWSPSFDGLFIYYPGHRQVSAALRAFIDMSRAPRASVRAKSSLKNPFVKI